jgi:hypothetical protein
VAIEDCGLERVSQEGRAVAFDWSLVIGSLVGACIGLAGDWSGRLGARRQADRAREQHRQDSASRRAIERDDERRRAVEQREAEALQRILSTMVQLLPGVSDARTRSDEAIPAAVRFIRVAATESLYVTDAGLRSRILIVVDAIDGVTYGFLKSFDLGECV